MPDKRTTVESHNDVQIQRNAVVLEPKRKVARHEKSSTMENRNAVESDGLVYSKHEVLVCHKCIGIYLTQEALKVHACYY